MADVRKFLSRVRGPILHTRTHIARAGKHMEDDPFVVGEVDAHVAASKPGKAELEEMIPRCVLSAKHRADVYGYDIAQMEERPWAKPGANLSDYFNYGFDEQTWRVHCAMQKEGRESLLRKAQDFYRAIEGQVTAASGGEPFAAQAAFMQRDNRMYKTKLCQQFLEGQCNRGDQCNYAHGQHELRQAPPRQGAYGAEGLFSMPEGMAKYPAPPPFHAPPYPAPPPMGPPPPMGAPPPMGPPPIPPPPPMGPKGFRMAPLKRDRDEPVFEPQI